MHASTGPSRSVPGYACPFAEHLERIQKRARPQSIGLRFHANTGRLGLGAFLSVFVALGFSRFDGEPRPAQKRLTLIAN